MPEIHGIIAYPITPFTADTAGIDTERLASLVDRLVSSAVHAIAPLGSTGELAYLDEPEFDTVVDTTMAAVNGRVPVIVGVSDLTTANTIRRAQYAQQAGADAVMILPVSYWKLTDREIAQHYRSIGESIDIPIMAYNNPATSGVDMSPELLVTMFDNIGNVTMVKESTGDLSRMRRIAELSDGQLPFYNGSNPLVLGAFLADWPGVPVGNEEGEIITAALGDKKAALLAHHGQVVAGATVEEACSLAVLIERAAKLQLAAMAAGTVKELPEELAREAHDWTLTPSRSRANFAYYARRALVRHPDVLNPLPVN